MIISVTKDDIKNGRQVDCKNCPVARAISKLLKPEYTVNVYYQTMRLLRGYIRMGDFYNSRSVSRFINAFDSGRKVKPFNFKVDNDFKKFCRG